MTNSVFSNDTTNETTLSASPLDTLVGEGKKFKTVEDLAKGKAESDEFIERLKAEKAELLKELDTRLTAEQAVEKALQAANKAVPAAASATKPEDLAKLVKDVLTSTKKEDLANANILQAHNLMVQKFGDVEQAKVYMAERAAELGVSTKDLMETAAKSPKAFANLLGIDTANTPMPSASVMRSDVQTPPPLQEKAGTKQYYDAMRRSNPSQYYSSSVQNEIFEAAKKGTYK